MGMMGMMAAAIHHAPCVSRESFPSVSFVPVCRNFSGQHHPVCWDASKVRSVEGLGFKGFGGLGVRWSLCNSATQASLRPGHFAEPSVTAKDVENYERRLSEEEAVAAYLESVGVDSTDVELPASLGIVRERVEFLLKIGLTVEDVNEYPLMLGYSVKRNLIPVLSYLESLGVTPKSLPILLRKYPQVLHSSVVVDLQPHVDYLTGLGIQRADMGTVLTRYPEVLGFRIEGTISTSTAYLVMLGVNPRRIGYILTELPQILGMRVGNNLKRKVDFLKSFGLTQSAIAKMIETRPQVLGLDLSEQMRPSVDSLIELGVPQDAINRVITQFPDVLSLDVKQKLDERISWLTSEVGISLDDMGSVIVRLPQILVINTTKAFTRVEFLRKSGFSPGDIVSMVTNCPQLLAASIDKSLKPNLEYLVKEMERKVSEVTEFPAYLLHSLDEVIRPRHEETKAKGVECSLAWMLNCDGDVFQQRLTLEYGEQRNEDEEPDVPYIVARRVRLTDISLDEEGGDGADESVTSSSRQEEDEEDEEDEDEEEQEDGPYIVTRRSTRLMDDSEDDAQSRSFG